MIVSNSTTTYHTSSNSLTVIQAIFYILGVHGLTTNAAILCFTVYKIINVRHYLLKNRIFIIYFLCLLLGAIFHICCDLLCIVFSKDIPEHIGLLDLFITLGSVFMDTFLTLVPNFYFSLVQSKLCLVKNGTTKKYFIINIIVSSTFIAFMPISCFTLSAVVPNVAQIIELLYAFGFYLLALWEFRNFDKKVQKVLWTFFMYFVLYAVVNIVANVYRALDEYEKNDPNHLTQSMSVHHVLYSFDIVLLILCLNKMRLKVKTTDSRNQEKVTTSN